MATRLILADNARVRYATGAMMYFAQGIPYGMMHIAIPAWLASQGIGAGQIASYLAVIILPWAFKLLSGPPMDTWEYLPMGRRRPWVLGAQLGLALSFLGLMFIDHPAQQIGWLTVVGLLINVFAATQDVAVDGMSIDLTPVDEQGRLNAFMTFGKAAGWGISSAVSGVLLVYFGLAVTAVVAAIVLGAVLMAFALVRERDGERMLPWSQGGAMAEARPGKSFSGLFKGMRQIMLTRVSMILMVVMFFDGLVSGYGHALMPIAAVNLFGFTTPEWSQLVAVMGLAGAAVALAFGPLIDRFGAKHMLFFTICLVAAHAFLLGETQVLWKDALYVKAMLSIWIMLGPITMVCVIALAMAICSSANSATQFAIFMSIGNLGISAGSKIYGLVAEQTSYSGAYVLLGVLAIALVILIAVYRHRHAHDRDGGRRAARAYTAGMGTSRAGTYWSGAMRCPKCRSDMEQVEVDGVQVDRCTTCRGLWFDPGEIELLRNRKAAAALDIGLVATGKAQNAIDHYRCPRCGGEMVRMVDPKQIHIWYEQCASCHGSYFDAGEFTDLVTVSIPDFFKRFTTPERR